MKPQNPKSKRIKLIKGYEKIAAGEVIERPASVVKELLENSIDAGATQITIIIKKFGKELIQVIDNGSGINKNDIETAFQAHTSSKIENAHEINNLHTLGFRGEALFSISAISKVEIITKTANDSMGTKCVLENGQSKSKEEIGSPLGTNIKIKDLFYNTPVRYKFLKTDRVEMGHITDIVTRIILANPKIHVKLFNSDIPVINSPSTSKYINKLFDIYGKKVAKQVFKYEHEDEDLKIEAYLGEPELSRSTSISSSTFVNKRYVTSPLIKDVFNEAYKDYVMVRKHPFYIIFLTVNPSSVDFNIHPTKKIIRFENETYISRRLTHLLKEAVSEKFGFQKSEDQQKSTKISTKPLLGESIQNIVNKNSKSSTKDSNPLKKTEYHFSTKFNNASSSSNQGKLKNHSSRPSSGVNLRSANPKRKNLPSPSIDKNFKKESPTNNQISAKQKPIDVPLDMLYPISKKQKTKLTIGKHADNQNERTSLQTYAEQSNWIDTNGVFPKLKIPNRASQLNKVYFILEGEDGFYILDMHAAHERINYEKQLSLFKEDGIKRQSLIMPVKFDVPVNEVDFIKDNIKNLMKYGFEIDSLGGNTFAIRTIPANYKNIKDPDMIRDICLEMISIGKQSSLSEEYDKIIKYSSCRMSIKGGLVIDNPQRVIELIKELSKCKNPHHCCHGRPTMLFFAYNEIDKMFHRIQ